MSTVTSKDGTTIAYERIGEGPAVVLVDGALCYRAFGPMEGLAKVLAPRFTVYTYDRRGRGESGDTQPFAVEREIEDIEAVIGEAGGTAFVYGISSGAFLALEAASRLPGKITKVALYEPPCSMSEAAVRQFEEYKTRLGAVLAEGRRGDAVGLMMRLVAGNLATEDEPMPDDPGGGLRGTPVWPMFEAVAPTLAYDAAAMGDSSVPTATAVDVMAPLLAMAGGNSPEWLRQGAETIANAAPNATYRTLDGQTHEVSSEALAPVLVEFFSAR